MENCTVYSHYPSFDRIESILRESFPKADIKVSDEGDMRRKDERSKLITVTQKAGLFSAKKTLSVNYREREVPSYTLDGAACALTTNLRGMYNFIGSIPTTHDKAKQLLLQKVSTLNCEFACIAEPGFTDEFTAAVQRIAREQEAIIFAQPGKTFSRSAAQHFLNADFQVILDVKGFSEADAVDVKIDARYFDSQETASSAQQARKEASEALLTQHGVAINKHLPVTPDAENVALQEPAVLLERAYALTLIAAKGEGVEQPRLDRVKADFRIDALSPYEVLVYAKATLDDREKAYASWRYESLNTILWALGLLESLPYPSAICDVSHIVGMMLQNSREALAARVNVRTADEILQELDKTYRMHWACVNARIKGQPVGGNLQPGVVYERHYALNWITQYGGQSWDDVTTNT